jgi:hypothetical protein
MNNKMYNWLVNNRRAILLVLAFIALTVAAIGLGVLVQHGTELPISPLSPMIASTPTPAPPLNVPGNLLANPGFEGEYINCGDGCNVAPGWTAWTSETLTPPCIAGEPGCYIPCPSNCDDCRTDYGCYWKRAEHKRGVAAEFPLLSIVHSGEFAQQAFTFGGMGEFGVWQQISTTPGVPLEIGGYVQGWQQCWPEQQGNCPQAKMNLRLGVDPFGGTDPYSPNVVWSTAVESFDAYTFISLIAIARANTATVFTYARPEWDWARMNNDAYVDDLYVVELLPTPTPVPSATPGPTPTMGPVVAELYLPCVLRNYLETPEPTYTPTPSVTPEHTYTPTPGATPSLTPTPDAPRVYVEPVYQSVQTNDVFTVSVIMAGIDDAEVVESRLYHSPVGMAELGITCDLPCDKARVIKSQPGVIAITCESSGVLGAGLLYSVAFTATHAGTFNLEPFTFIGTESGGGYIPNTNWWWGFPVDITTGVVEVK